MKLETGIIIQKGLSPLIFVFLAINNTDVKPKCDLAHT
jgi:hypothetical protein